MRQTTLDDTLSLFRLKSGQFKLAMSLPNLQSVNFASSCRSRQHSDKSHNELSFKTLNKVKSCSFFSEH